MNESIASRVSRLISGGINAIVDKAESISPEIVMKETIREVDSVIDEVKIELGKQTVELRKTKSQLDSEIAKYEKLSEQVKIAISEQRDDLAKTAISRQMDIEAQVPILEVRVEEISADIEKLENYIDALNAKKREMQNELDEYIKFTKEQKESQGINQSIEKAEAAFNRVNKIETNSLLNENDVKLAELDKLSRNNRITERLESLKANRG